MCGIYLDREVHTARDLLDPVQQGIDSYPQTPWKEGKDNNREPEISTKTTFTTKLATQQGISLQKYKGNNNLSDKATREDRNN